MFYRKLQTPAELDETLFRRLLHGLSARHCADCAGMVPDALGLSASSVSRRFVAVSAAKLAAFQEEA